MTIKKPQNSKGSTNATTSVLTGINRQVVIRHASDTFRRRLRVGKRVFVLLREERGSREVELRVVVSVCACPTKVALDEGGDDYVEVGGGVCEEGVFAGYEVAV